MKLMGVILSGGKSSRMGTDKGLLVYNKRPLIHYAIEALRPYCDTIAISTNNHNYNALGCSTFADIIADIGPIGGIYSAMKTNKAEKYFVLSCDQPHNNGELIQKLISESVNSEIIVPVHNGKIEPLHGIYSYSVLTKIENQIALTNYKMMNLLKSCDTAFYEVPENILESTPNLFKNINTLKDLK